MNKKKQDEECRELLYFKMADAEMVFLELFRRAAFYMSRPKGILSASMEKEMEVYYAHVKNAFRALSDVCNFVDSTNEQYYKPEVRLQFPRVFDALNKINAQSPAFARDAFFAISRARHALGFQIWGEDGYRPVLSNSPGSLDWNRKVPQ